MNATEILQIVMPRSGPRAVVLCDGPRPSSSLLAGCLEGADHFICADMAGWPHHELPRLPDVVIGDFDTLGEPPEDLVDVEYLHRPEQDTTDSEKALLLALEKGCSEALLLGATGELLDHSLANIALAERFSDRMRIALVDGTGVSLRISNDDEVSWALPADTVVSLVPVGGPARVTTLAGVRWPLTDQDLVWGGASTISNQVIDSPLRLILAEGSVLVTIRAGREA